MQREDHKRLFGDSRTRTFQLTLLEETYEAAQQIARDNKWQEDYANVIIFANGLSFLQAKVVLQQINSGDSKAGETIRKLAAELQKYTAMYSAMKYQAFLMTTDNESMDWAINALRIENSALKNRLDLFRADEERLKGELGQLRREREKLETKVAELSTALEAGGTGAVQTRRLYTPRGWLRRLFGRGK